MASDDALDQAVARHEEELAARLRQDIAAAGEGGWQSPWYTGPSDPLPSGRQHDYRVWKLARDDWAHTGNPQHLAMMLSAVSFTSPPHLSEVKTPPQEKPARQPVSDITFQGQLLVIGVLYLVAAFVLAVVAMAIT